MGECHYSRTSYTSLTCEQAPRSARFDHVDLLIFFALAEFSFAFDGSLFTGYTSPVVEPDLLSLLLFITIYLFLLMHFTSFQARKVHQTRNPDEVYPLGCLKNSDSRWIMSLENSDLMPGVSKALRNKKNSLTHEKRSFSRCIGRNTSGSYEPINKRNLREGVGDSTWSTWLMMLNCRALANSPLPGMWACARHI